MRALRVSPLHRRIRGALPVGLLPLAAGGCAMTGSTLGSGVGDALLERAPYYAGRTVTGVEDPAPRTGHLPVTFQKDASTSAVFDPSDSPAVRDLLERMTAFLDARGRTLRLVEGGRVSAVSHAATRFPPDVRFGCETVSAIPDDDCVERGDSALGRGPQRMVLSAGRPSPEWTEWARQVMDDQGVDRVLVVTLEGGQYWTRQRGWRGTKEVELGTGHVQEVPWLTSLETPVSVLQLTGAVVGRDGKAIRIGAEGLLARPTRLGLSALGAQELITDEDVERLATARREDLPGAPLVWEEGLRALLEQLGG